MSGGASSSACRSQMPPSRTWCTSAPLSKGPSGGRHRCAPADRVLTLGKHQVGPCLALLWPRGCTRAYLSEMFQLSASWNAGPVWGKNVSFVPRLAAVCVLLISCCGRVLAALLQVGSNLSEVWHSRIMVRVHAAHQACCSPAAERAGQQVWGGSRRLFDAMHERSRRGQGSYLEVFLQQTAVEHSLKVALLPLLASAKGLAY